jgi:hypothetical protein
MGAGAITSVGGCGAGDRTSERLEDVTQMSLVAYPGRSHSTWSLADRVSMAHDIRYVTLADEEPRIWRDGGPGAIELMKRKSAECQRLLSQSDHESVSVVLTHADGEEITVNDDGTPHDDGSDPD